MEFFDFDAAAASKRRLSLEYIDPPECHAPLTAPVSKGVIGNDADDDDDIDGEDHMATLRFPSSTIRILTGWMELHANHPYPSAQQKQCLMNNTGLNKTQLSDWFANARRRKKICPSHGSGPSPLTDSQSEAPAVYSHSGGLDPIDRYLSEPLDAEAASVADISRALTVASISADGHPDTEEIQAARSANGECTSSRSSSPYTDTTCDDGSSTIADCASQADTAGTPFSSAVSYTSSIGLGTSLARKARKRPQKARSDTSRSTTVAKQRFQCTMCKEAFSTKYDWQRHESSVHLILERWVCIPNGSVVMDGDKQVCAFCMSPEPDQDHLDSHTAVQCHGKSADERTFYRKDHLRQHLKLVHGVGLGKWMASWKSMLGYVRSRCGFCSAVFTTWRERVEHIAGHFKNGADMERWRGGLGFEPDVQNIVDGSIAPELVRDMGVASMGTTCTVEQGSEMGLASASSMSVSRTVVDPRLGNVVPGGVMGTGTNVSYVGPF